MVRDASRVPCRLIVDTKWVTSLALFDLDNTLLDREQAFALWTRQFIAVHGLGADASPTIGRADADGYKPREEFFADLRREFDITTSINELLADYYVEYPSKFSVEPEVLDAVRSLRAAGFKVGVVTNGPPSQSTKLEAAGIEDEFDAVCVSAVVGAHKPDRSIFEEAARLCGLPLVGWMVGDSPEADIAGGLEAGLRTIWMSRGREWIDLNYSPEFTVSSIPAAVEIILRLG
jgi:HAD superfamily hydrolase (TIGR01549 family)